MALTLKPVLKTTWIVSRIGLWFHRWAPQLLHKLNPLWISISRQGVRVPGEGQEGGGLAGRLLQHEGVHQAHERHPVQADLPARGEEVGGYFTMVVPEASTQGGLLKIISVGILT